MANVRIKFDPKGKTRADRFVCEVDGVDLSAHVLAHGVAVDLGDGRHEASVTLTLAAESLDLDLPESVVTASRGAA